MIIEEDLTEPKIKSDKIVRYPKNPNQYYMRIKITMSNKEHLVENKEFIVILEPYETWFFDNLASIITEEIKQFNMSKKNISRID